MSKNRFQHLILPWVAALSLSVGLAGGFWLAQPQNTHNSPSGANASSLSAIIGLLKTHYVDSLSQDSLTQFAIEGMLNHLDPHTVYIPASELQAINEGLNGTYFGLGISYYTWLDTLHVTEIIPGSPAEKIGLQFGDQILQLENDTLVGEDKIQRILDKHLIREKAEPVSLWVKHLNGKFERYRIIPEIIARSTISASLMLDANCGYIQITGFSEPTAEEFHTALLDLKKAGLKQLIIDVRGNPGGYMDAVAAIADELIPGKDTLFFIRSQFGSEATLAQQDGLHEQGDVCILIDEESASASEILAGIVQDYDRGMVIGTTSFGKGLVQEQYELPDGAAIRVTTARYYLPSGRSIQRNFHQMDREAYFLGIRPKKEEPGKAYVTKRKKRLVYGGNGIQPDIPITVDELITNYPQNLLYRKWAQQWLYASRHKLPTFSNYSDMQARAKVPADWNAFIAREAKQLPDSLAYYYSQNQNYNNIRCLSEWAYALFGSNGQIAFAYPNDKVLFDAFRYLKKNNSQTANK